jgi:hypothetical protein
LKTLLKSPLSLNLCRYISCQVKIQRLSCTDYICAFHSLLSRNPRSSCPRHLLQYVCKSCIASTIVSAFTCYLYLHYTLKINQIFKRSIMILIGSNVNSGTRIITVIVKQLLCSIHTNIVIHRLAMSSLNAKNGSLQMRSEWTEISRPKFNRMPQYHHVQIFTGPRWDWTKILVNGKDVISRRQN